MFILTLTIVVNDNDYQYQYVAYNTIKKCIWAWGDYVYAWLYINMADEKISILLSDISIEGDLVEKDKIIIDAQISGDIKSDDVETYVNSNITGNIDSKNASLGGKLKGNVSSDKIQIMKTAEIEGVLNQKILSIEEGSILKIKTETYK